MLATSSATRQPLDVAIGDLVLRVCGPPRDGQIVRLRSAKCTIGCGSRCTLRLRAVGVAPLHCLILRGRGGTVVRRWAADTRLNQRPFTDAQLSPGDRLSIGPIELDVVSTGVEPVDFAPPSSALPPQGQQPHAKQTEPQQRTNPDRDELAAEQAELESQRNALLEERRRWETRREEDAARHAAHRQQLAVQTAELEAQCQTFDRQRQQWQSEQAATQQRLSDECVALAAERAELGSQRNALVEERRQWEAERAGLPPTAGDGVESPRPAEMSPKQESQPQAVHSQEMSPSAPVNLADVLHRLGAAVDLPDDEPEPRESSEKIERPTNEVAQVPAPPAAPSANDDEHEESVDQYMARLMQRIRSVSGADPDSPTPSPADPARAGDDGSTNDRAAAQSRPTATLGHGWTTRLRQAVTPEKHVDLSALRELANLSAQSAISRHSHRTLTRTMRSKLMVAVVAVLVGAGLLWMWRSLDASQLTFLSSLAALVVAIYWGAEYAVLTGRLIVSKSGHIHWNSSPYGKRPAPSVENGAEKTPQEDAGPPTADAAETAAVAPSTGDSTAVPPK